LIYEKWNLSIASSDTIPIVSGISLRTGTFLGRRRFVSTSSCILELEHQSERKIFLLEYQSEERLLTSKKIINVGQEVNRNWTETSSNLLLKKRHILKYLNLQGG
jgi:hypothetical protein